MSESGVGAVRIQRFERELDELVQETQGRLQPGARERFAYKVELQYLGLLLELVESVSKEASLSVNEGYSEVVKRWNRLRKATAMMKRRLQLLHPANQHQFEANLGYLSEQGEFEDLDFLRKLRLDPPFQSDRIFRLIEKALQNIDQRGYNQIEQHPDMETICVVFCPQGAAVNFSQGVFVIQEYPSFTVISATEDMVFRLRENYPVGKLSRDESSASDNLAEQQQDVQSDHELRLVGEAEMRDIIVQFIAPISERWKTRLESIGAKILQPFGHSALIVAVPNLEAIDEIRGFNEVAQVEPFEPEIRVTPQFLSTLGQEPTDDAIAEAMMRAAANSQDGGLVSHLPLPGILIADFFTERDRDRAQEALGYRGIKIIDSPGSTRLILDLTSTSDPFNDLRAITNQVGLRTLEEENIEGPANDIARKLIGDGVVLSNPMGSGLDLTGKGEIIAIADSGLDTGDQATIHQDFRGRVKYIKSFPIRASLDPLVDNKRGDDGPADLYTGHGTHVAGSALGNGVQAKQLGCPDIQGMAPEAELVFQAIEQTIKWNKKGILNSLQNKNMLPPAQDMVGIPDDLDDLFQPAYDNGARIHSNSWAGGTLGQYNRRSQDIDRFMWNHKDFLVLVAAGNSGKNSSSAIQAIDKETVLPPGTAKNCLTVGASENDRIGQFQDTYGNWWPKEFPYSPFHSNGLVDSIDDIAAFSGRGPCKGGRRKPDLIAPGTFILSTRSSQIPSNHFAWGAFPPAKQYYMYMGGTSMSTPLVAGAAALVRQYLRENIKISNPTSALVKAALIHSTNYVNYKYCYPSSGPDADNDQGWGRISLNNVLAPPRLVEVVFIDEPQGLITGEAREYRINIADSSVPLRATLVYTDFPGRNLINNLNLLLISPDSKTYFGNDFNNKGVLDAINNVEGRIIKSPLTGVWSIRVVAFEVQEARQDFALIISGGGLTRI
jgi:serine protease AprX